MGNQWHARTPPRPGRQCRHCWHNLTAFANLYPFPGKSVSSFADYSKAMDRTEFIDWLNSIKQLVI